MGLALGLATVGTACDEKHSDPPTPMPSSATGVPTRALASPPFMLSEPVAAAVALDAASLTGSSWYVLDLASGFIQVIAPDLSEQRVDAQGGRAGVFPSWFDDSNDALIVRNIDGATYVADLSGVLRPSASPVATPTEPSPTGGGVSHDERWQASVTAVDGPGVVIGTMDLGGPGGEPRFKVTSATLPLWSPTAPATLALLVNACSGPNTNAGFDLSLFDPVGGELRDLSALTDQLIPTFVWRLDGSSIVADVVINGASETETRRELQLIDVSTGVAQTLVTIAQGGELIPVEWNRDGSKLLFTYSPGRGLCEGTGPAGPPSELQRFGG